MRMAEERTPPEDTPDPDSEKPRFLLPEGCKDLIDALRVQQQKAGSCGNDNSNLSRRTIQAFSFLRNSPTRRKACRPV